MSDKKLEVIPPEKKTPAKKAEDGGFTVSHDLQPRGIIESAVTGFQAEMQARAYDKIASAIRAQTDALEAETARKKSTLKLFRAAHELEETPDIVALDRAERSMNRAETYEELKHQSELNKRRRERELEEADRRVVDAKYSTFNSRQGLENAQRLKEIKLKIFEKLAATEDLTTEKALLHLMGEIDRAKGLKGRSQEGLVEQLSSLRSLLEKRARDKAANGDAVQAEEDIRLAADVEKLVLSILRAGLTESPGD